MKNKSYISLIVILLAATIPTSCIMYRPHNVDIPLLQEQGDLRVDASVSTTFPTLTGTAANLSAAYAVLPNVGVTGYGTLSDWSNRYGQLAAGTFWPVSTHAVFEAYVGYGGGHSHHKNTQSNGLTRIVKGPYSLFFSQINFGWAGLGKDVFDAGIGLKSGLLNSHWSNNLFDADNVVQNDNEMLERPFFLMEPQLVLRVGSPTIKFSLNIAYSYIPDWPTYNAFFNYERISVSAGVNLKF